MEKANIGANAKSDLEYLHLIGEFIKRSRLDADLTQNIAAEHAGVDRSTIIKIEKGESITLMSLIQILRALGKLDVLEGMKYKTQVSPLEMAKLSMKTRERASNKLSHKENKKSDW